MGDSKFKYCVIRQRSKVRYVKNPISGHEWPEETLLQTWDVVGQVGKVGTAGSYEKAVAIAKEYEEFYEMLNNRIASMQKSIKQWSDHERRTN